jgi:hypothetical protein
MKFNMSKHLLTSLAALVLGLAGQVAQAGPPPQQKLTVTVAATANAAVNGNTSSAALLVSVNDPNGDPVLNLQLADITVLDFVVPQTAPCGFVATQSTVVKPGFYQIALSMPDASQCHWVTGDYLGAVRIMGQVGAPFKLTAVGAGVS